MIINHITKPTWIAFFIINNFSIIIIKVAYY